MRRPQSLIPTCAGYMSIVASRVPVVANRGRAAETRLLAAWPEPLGGARVLQHCAIDEELGNPPVEGVDDTPQAGRRHVVKALIGPAQGMRCDDHVVHCQ